MYDTNGNGGGMSYSMPVAPAMYGGYGNGGGLLGGFGGDGNAILLLLLFAIFGGNGWGNGGMNGNGIYPWMNQSNQISDGFRDQMINGNITGIQTSLNNGFASAEVAACNRAMDQMQTAYQGQINALERSFAEQTANVQGFNQLQGQLAQCCCDNRLATCQTQNLISNEGAATRLAIDNAAQRLSDKLCQLELDAKNDTIAELRTRVNMQALAASQTAQTAQLVADNTAQTQYIVNRVAPYPIPSYTVPNPFGTATTTAAAG